MVSTGTTVYPVGMSFGRGLIAVRRRLGVSQEALAERAGMQRSHLSKIENGRITMPSYEVVKRLASALGITAGELYSEGKLTEGDPGRDAAEIARVIANWTPAQRRWLLDLMERTDEMLGDDADETDGAA